MLLLLRSLSRTIPSKRSAWRTLGTRSQPPQFHSVLKLESWDTDAFRQQAFVPGVPAHLPHDEITLPPACHKWFINSSYNAHNDDENKSLTSSRLNAPFWESHASLTVPLELTAKTTFLRSDASLSLLLDHLEKSSHSMDSHSPRLYLAQHPLPSLPTSLRSDLPTPKLILSTGKGDIYDSSLWLGLAPTYTPLHRDPNPNLLQQLAGTKLVRLFPPSIGLAIFERVQDALGQSSSAVFRGEEMMHGAEKELLEREVWDDPATDSSPSASERIALHQHGFEARIDLGEALFIPKGWWHSVKSIGQGVSASANWWFR